MPLLARKKLLRAVLRYRDPLRFSAYRTTHGEADLSPGRSRSCFPWRSRTPLTQLAKAQWQAYFDRISRTLAEAKRVDIDVAGLGLGHQVEAESIALLGLSYDPNNDRAGEHHIMILKNPLSLPAP